MVWDSPPVEKHWFRMSNIFLNWIFVFFFYLDQFIVKLSNLSKPNDFNDSNLTLTFVEVKKKAKSEKRIFRLDFADFCLKIS